MKPLLVATAFSVLSLAAPATAHFQLVYGPEATGPVSTQLLYGVGSGARMLSRAPELPERLLGWFLRPGLEPGAVPEPGGVATARPSKRLEEN